MVFLLVEILKFLEVMFQFKHYITELLLM
jgi:hypothetical protein